MKEVVHKWEVTYKNNDIIYIYHIEADNSLLKDIENLSKKLKINNDLFSSNIIETDIRPTYFSLLRYKIKRLFNKHIKLIESVKISKDRTIYDNIEIKYKIKSLDLIEDDNKSSYTFSFDNITKEDAKNKSTLKMNEIKNKDNYSYYSMECKNDD